MINLFQHRGELPTVLSMHNRLNGRGSATFSRAWEDTDNSHELIESIFNYCSIVYHIRPWSPEAWALIRAFHDCRFEKLSSVLNLSETLSLTDSCTTAFLATRNKSVL